MGKFFTARRAKEWKAMLMAFGYVRLDRNDGDDQVWARSGCAQVVFVPDRDSEVIIITTAMDMVRKIEFSGIKRKEILKWWKENGYGE